MRLASLAALALLACTPASSPNPSTVYGELVKAGCMAPSADGVTAIAADHARADERPWLACLFDGGSVTSCAVPCQ